MSMTDVTHECSYCRYYATSRITGEVEDAQRFRGNIVDVVLHADIHPIGDPLDYPIQLPEDERINNRQI